MPALTSASEGFAREGAAPVDQTAVYTEGITAGLAGAATIAIWFFVLDVFRGHPFYTPTVLGRTFLYGGLRPGEVVTPSFEPVFAFTGVHVLVFLVLGFLAARLSALAARDSNYGFGLVLGAVIFIYGFIGVCMVFAEPVLHALTWPAILVGNLLAVVAMTAVLYRHHKGLRIEP
jgi:hypothetical protein